MGERETEKQRESGREGDLESLAVCSALNRRAVSERQRDRERERERESERVWGRERQKNRVRVGDRET